MTLLNVRLRVCLSSLLVLPMSCADASGVEQPSETWSRAKQPLVAVNLEGTSDIDFYECATEGSDAFCASAVKNRLFAFGANGHYNYQQRSDIKVPCNRDTFGDPIPDVTKKCYASNYEYMTSEDTKSYTFGRTSVAFGANGKFVSAVLGSPGKAVEFTCDRATFGGDANDPAVGVRKACYRALFGFQHAVDETIPPTQIELGPDPVPVAYGANGRFFFRRMSGTITCGNDAFGDPIPNVSKACYVLIDELNKYNSAEGEPLALPSKALYGCQFIYASGIDGGFVYNRFLSFDPSAPSKCDTSAFYGDPSPQSRKYCWGTCANVGGGPAFIR